MRAPTESDIDYIEQLEAEQELADGIARHSDECNARLTAKEEARRVSDQICEFTRELVEGDARDRCNASQERMIVVDMTVNGACGGGISRN